jgi:predicted ATPase/class 3 adenylate cyclase
LPVTRPSVIIPRVRGLPSGTVTFLFTDIEGSTRLVQELGDEYAGALASHRRLLRDAFLRHRGVEVDSQGDAFFIAFARATDAVAAASAAQQSLASGPVRVRMGIHTGEPLATDEGYVGIDVHRAARIMGAGHGGQVLLSEATKQLLDSNVRLRDLGEHRLKDLSAPQRLYQLGAADFPRLRTLYQANLPVQSTGLIGRKTELGEAGALLSCHRLLTLTGPGGSGKTRLALQLAAEAIEQFPDGVFWVPLQALRDPALVERAIAASIEANEDLLDCVGSKQLLILLDNFEQIIDAAPTVASLLVATPNAKVLVTSREPLHVESEQRYPVEPLPDDDAAQLFGERARSVVPGFRPSAVVREICRRLDGLPLAIELAAARIGLLDPDELLVRLDRRLPLLAGRSRDAPARQRTLRATIEWSYQLLVPNEQEVLRRLAVFRGSFSLEAAERVCDADLHMLESLLEKNLLRRWGSGRLGMLETIREYTRERLGESPEADEVRRRHAEFFLALAQSANLNTGLVQRRPQRLDIANLEQDNIRGALDWTIASGAVRLGLELAVALEQFWVTDDPVEGMRWFEALLQRSGAEGVPLEVRGHALRSYGSAAGIAGETDLAERLWEQSLALFGQLGDDHGRAVLLHRLAIVAMFKSKLKRARELVAESHEIHERTGDVWGQAQTVGTLGAIARDTGDEERAFGLMERSAKMALEAGVQWWQGGMLAELSALSLNAGRVDAADIHARAALAIAQQLRDRAGCVFGVGLLACVAGQRGQLERAGRLWAAIESKDAGAPLGGWRRHRQTCESRLRSIDSPDFKRGYAEGRGLTLEDAVSIAMESHA